MHARSRTALTAVIALGLSAFALPAHAQDAALAPTAATAAPASGAAPAVATTPAAGPTVDAATVGVRHREDATAAPARHGGSAPGTALMIVGGAAILVGLVIGKGAGDAIAVGGAVVGLVGLYQYLQ